MASESKRNSCCILRCRRYERPISLHAYTILTSITVVGGPTLGPVIGSALTNNPNLGWRWTEYIEAIWTFAITAMAILCLPEVYAPVLLHRRAQKLRKETGNQDLYHPHENVKLDFKSLITKQFTRPLKMLFTEPMVTCIALYASFVYAILYLTLEVFPIVFAEQRDWGPVVSTLPFLALFVGVLCSIAINLGNQPRYIRKVDEAKGKPVPEARLPPMAIGAVLFCAGLFWFGWTADRKFHWIIPVIAAGFIGAGFNVIFQQCINFLVGTSFIHFQLSDAFSLLYLKSSSQALFPSLQARFTDPVLLSPYSLRPPSPSSSPFSPNPVSPLCPLILANNKIQIHTASTPPQP